MFDINATGGSGVLLSRRYTNITSTYLLRLDKAGRTDYHHYSPHDSCLRLSSKTLHALKRLRQCTLSQ